MSKKIEDVYPELKENQYLNCVIDNKGNIVTQEDVKNIDLDEKQFIMAQPMSINIYIGFKLINNDLSNIIMPEM